MIHYILYKNPGFWLVNSRCIFRVFSYLGLISFIFTTAGVFAWGFNFFPAVPWYLRKRITLLLLSRDSNRQLHSEYFFFTFIRKVAWLIKFETRKCSEVKDLTFFPSMPWYLRKRISLFNPHVPQTAKFIRNTSTTVWHNKSKYYHCTCWREQFKASYSI